MENNAKQKMDLEKEASLLGIRYFMIAYNPLNTDTRTCLVPASAIRVVQMEGYTICGGLYFKINSADPELYLFPDTTTLIQLPWKPEVAWVMGNLYWKGVPFTQCPRNILKMKIENAKKLGYEMKSGVEAEFMLFAKDRKKLYDESDEKEPFNLHNPHSLLVQFDLLTKINDIIEELGWKPYRICHEAAPGQFEINFGYEDALVTADRLCFFKFMVKELAKLDNMCATFMPCPRQDISIANGLHINISMWDTHDNKNLFTLTNENYISTPSNANIRISDIAMYSMGGMLEHAKQICAILCPSVNSYKRLNKASWCPNTLSWGFENRSVMIRIPTNERLEHRLADSTNNPHLAHAALLICILEGIKLKIDPGEPINCPIGDVKGREFDFLPTNLFEALQNLKSSKLMRKELGDDLVDAFLYLKDIEFKNYSMHLSQWESDNYFN